MSSTRPLAVPLTAAPRSPTGGVPGGLLRAARPKQWVKNVLVVAAPGAAGVLGSASVLGHVALAFLAFTLVSAGCYLDNDAADVHADRGHPVKRFRPLASGRVPLALARAVSVLLIGGGLAVGAVGSVRLLAVLGVYLMLTLGYSRYLKRVPVVELLVVSSGFVLRAVAGAAATAVPVSQWFLIVTSFGALFLVVSKRYAELGTLGEAAAAHRPVLAAYPVAFVRQVRDVSATVTLLAYCLWAFQRAATEHTHIPWDELSIIPVTLGVFRYALVVENGGGGAPEDVLLADRTIGLSLLIWAVLFALGLLHA